MNDLEYLRKTLGSVACEDLREDNLAIFILSAIEPHIEDETP